MSELNDNYILTPAARLVMGSAFEFQTTDAEGRPLVVKTGANAGQPRVEYYIGVAIPKTDPEWPAIWAKISEVARTSFPTLFDPSGNCLNPEFAYKVIDGDSTVPNKKGKKPAERDGFPGHWILSFSNGFPPKVLNTGGKEAIVDPNALKRGYYVRVYGSIKGNGSLSQPGVFLNHSMIEFIAYGEEIVSGPSGEEIFGGAAATSPAGASATPIAPATTIAQPGAQAGPGPAASAGPAADILSGPAPAAEVKRLHGNGQAYTEAELAPTHTPEQIAALPIAP